MGIGLADLNTSKPLFCARRALRRRVHSSAGGPAEQGRSHAPEWTRTTTSYSLTRPSTLRVYQFRHGRREREYRRLIPSSRGASLHEHVFGMGAARC